MRVHKTDKIIAARNREQGAKAQLVGGCIFAVGIVIMAMAGFAAWPMPLTGHVVGCIGRMTVDGNRVN